MFHAFTLAIVLVATATLAQPPQPSSPPTEPATTRLGPSIKADEVVCIASEPLGSRLARRRVCRTRGEWDGHRIDYREKIEMAQRPRGR